MLVNLTANDIADRWGKIRQSIIETYPSFMPITMEELTNILSTIMSGQMDVYEIQTDQGTAIGYLTTVINRDYCVGIKSLFVYTLWTNGAMTRRIWLEGWKQLVGIARAKGCKKIIGLSNIKSVIDMVKWMGGNAEMTYIELEV